MQSRSQVPAEPLLQWVDVGELPTAVTDWLEARMRKSLPIFSVVGGLVFGGLSGFASNSIASGQGSFMWNLPLFFAIGIPVGIGEFFFTRWFVPRTAKARQLQVRRVAISSDKLHLELDSGKAIEWTLKRVRVSKEPRAGDWYVVWISAGRTSLSFWAPPLIASSIRTAVPT